MRATVKFVRTHPFAIVAMVLGVTLCGLLAAAMYVVVVSPLDVPGGRTLHQLFERTDRVAWPRVSVTTWRVCERLLRTECAVIRFAPGHLRFDQRHRPVRLAAVSASFFSLLDRPLLHGRLPLVDDELLVSYEFFQGLGAALPNPASPVSVSLNGQAMRIVGVARPHFDFPERRDVWGLLDSRLIDSLPADARILVVLFRWSGDTTAVVARMQEAHDNSTRQVERAQAHDWGLEARSLLAEMRQPYARAAGLAAGAGFGVVTVALLGFLTALLVHADSARHEIQVRRVLGATNRRIVWEWTRTQMLLSALLCGASLPLVAGVASAIASTAPVGSPLGQLERGQYVGLITVVVLCTVTALAGSLLSYGVSTRRRPAAARSSVSRVAGAAVAGQVCTVLVSLIVALAVISHVATVTTREFGVDGRGTFAARISATADEGGETREAVLRVARAFGLDVALTSSLPIGESLARVEVKAVNTEARAVRAAIMHTTANFAEVLGLPLLAGRTFEGSQEAIIDDRVASALWQGHPPLGERVLIGGQPYAVVGVVRALRYEALTSPETGAVYVPLPAEMPGGVALVAGPAVSRRTVEQFVGEVQRAHDRIAVDALRSIDEVVGGTTAVLTHYSRITVAGTVVGVLAALMGLSNVVRWYVEAQRVSLAIRAALGAPRWAVFRASVEPLAVAAALGAASAVACVMLSWPALSTITDTTASGGVAVMAGATITAAVLIAGVALHPTYVLLAGPLSGELGVRTSGE